MDTLKAEQIGSAKWRVLAIPFGGPLKGGRDLDGEFFSRNTDIKPRWFRERPVLFHHGQDATLKDTDLGIEEMDDEAAREGWWGTVWLDRSARYWERVSALLAAGKMYGSSGAIAHLVKKGPDGEILVWPHAEQTLTLTPANPFARITASKAVPDWSAIGADLPPDLLDGGEPTGDLLTSGDVAAMRRRRALAYLEARLRATT